MVLDSLRELARVDPSRPAIEVEDVHEIYRLYKERPTGIKERLTRRARTDYEEFHALAGVSLTIEHGETVGIIGHNGSGKSTLLKVLARILPPDRGEVRINGRLASLLELGAGFHGDLSGRENIYLNGAILGLSREEIDERFDDIVDFAGIRQFLDTAVRNYSSGMYVRLGFAIAVNVDPDILLIDEVLSVGDAQFQERSMARMASFKERGKTVVVVSHDLPAVQRLCDRIVLLDKGVKKFDGPAGEGVQLYSRLMGTRRSDDERGDGSQLGQGRVTIEEVELSTFDDTPIDAIAPSDQLKLRIRLRALEDLDRCSVGAVFSSGDEDKLYEVHTAWQGLGVGPLRVDERATVDIRFTAHVMAGQYYAAVSVTDEHVRDDYAVLPDAIEFEVKPAPGGAGLVDFVASTSVVEGPTLRLGGEPADAGAGAS